MMATMITDETVVFSPFFFFLFLFFLFVCLFVCLCACFFLIIFPFSTLQFPLLTPRTGPKLSCSTVFFFFLKREGSVLFCFFLTFPSVHPNFYQNLYKYMNI
ncbi:hypothetical protein, unlikely [Trypanosoma brucei gambiense DAL972]|uniref:Uncharacterized protein n=1 Tax=Trypanosoma brucei gambiense (strain MHOM/CI/86/DAL972) TaxID=679716 RepID=C9ZQ97_TRYB9|nr:hypothetical protein, unlikely [Trypanosoma brucei gambiense DAL972]CBH11577.1 hypothetical protein, unlikely [Trypanosoma brucei gambiense DAL972]|eukprot:XP_011773862.1 hypothetical protein, unlikely [Trypanosoma brucei gambiense DAL972]